MRAAPKVEAIARKEDGLPDFWSLGPTAAAVGLRALGFSPHEAERLVTLKLRYLRGEFPKLTIDEKRLRFVRWLSSKSAPPSSRRR